MAAKMTRLLQPANPTIDQVCEEFLAEQRQRLMPRTVSPYEDVLGLLRHYLRRDRAVEGNGRQHRMHQRAKPYP